jgi:hypothetical protein
MRLKRNVNLVDREIIIINFWCGFIGCLIDYTILLCSNNYSHLVVTKNN